MLDEKERTQALMQFGFGAAVDDEEDDVIGKPLGVTLGCKPLAKKEQERGKKRGRKDGRKKVLADLSV